MQQFCNRLYAPLFTAGSNFWVQGFGNYVGHNAIIRTWPFMKYCDLPQLPVDVHREPFRRARVAEQERTRDSRA